MDLLSFVGETSDTLCTREMDFKFDLDLKRRKSAKKGKRLPFSFSMSPREETPSSDLGLLDSGTSSKRTSSPPKTRRSGGWAGDGLASAMRRGSSTFIEQEQLDMRLKDDEDDIPVIPNLDDYDEDIAKAPMVGQKVATYKELEIDLLKHAAFASLEDINLRVLTTFLQSEAALEEPDVPWTRETLFGEVVGRLHQKNAESRQ